MNALFGVAQQLNKDEFETAFKRNEQILNKMIAVIFPF